MVKTITINSSHWNAGRNAFVYQLRGQMVCPRDVDSVALSTCSFYNSTFNISSSIGNNTITLGWLGTNYTITIPDGYYSASDINSYLQGYSYSNKLYMVDATGNPIYFIECQINSQRYKISLNFYYIPTLINAAVLGFTQPATPGWSYPATNTCPTLTISSGLGTLLGLAAGTYGTGSVNNVNLSTITPNISPVNSYVFCCNLLNNPYSVPLSNIFYTVPLSAGFGAIVEDKQPALVWNDICDSTYQTIEIQLYDQNFNNLIINDYDFTITLALSKEKKGIN
jgi:hypothetical protein